MSSCRNDSSVISYRMESLSAFDHIAFVLAFCFDGLRPVRIHVATRALDVAGTTAGATNQFDGSVDSNSAQTHPIRYDVESKHSCRAISFVSKKRESRSKTVSQSVMLNDASRGFWPIVSSSDD